jgi:hypothetical protein
MLLIRLIPRVLVCGAVATPAFGDVTLRMKATEGLSGDRQSEITEHRKGLKLRTDHTANGVTMSSIVDAGTGRSIMLWHHSKSAEVFDSKSLSESLAKDRSGRATQSITRTAASRQIAGSRCTVYNFRASFPMPPMEMVDAATMVIDGTICLVSNGPGQADFTAFYRASAESVSVLDPNANGQTGSARLMAEMYLQMAKLGVPFAREMTYSFEGPGPDGARMTKAVDTHRTEVTSVSTAPIPDSMFEVPAGYTVVKR